MPHSATAMLHKVFKEHAWCLGLCQFVPAFIASLLKLYHVQVNVPTANVDEILPAARLLSRATAVAPIDYERAKTVFLQSVQHAGLAAKVVASATSGPLVNMVAAVFV